MKISSIPYILALFIFFFLDFFLSLLCTNNSHEGFMFSLCIYGDVDCPYELADVRPPVEIEVDFSRTVSR